MRFRNETKKAEREMKVRWERLQSTKMSGETLMGTVSPIGSILSKIHFHILYQQLISYCKQQ